MVLKGCLQFFQCLPLDRIPESHRHKKVKVTIVEMNGDTFELLLAEFQSVDSVKAMMKTKAHGVTDMEAFFVETDQWYLREGIGITMKMAGLKEGDVLYMKARGSGTTKKTLQKTNVSKTSRMFRLTAASGIRDELDAELPPTDTTTSMPSTAATASTIATTIPEGVAVPESEPQPPPPPLLPPPPPPPLTGHRLKMAQRAADPWESHRKKTRASQVGTLGLALLSNEAKNCRKEAGASTTGFAWESQRARKQESSCCVSFAVRLAILCNDPANLRCRRVAQSTAQSIPGTMVVQVTSQLKGESSAQCDLNVMRTDAVPAVEPKEAPAPALEPSEEAPGPEEACPRQFGLLPSVGSWLRASPEVFTHPTGDLSKVESTGMLEKAVMSDGELRDLGRDTLAGA
jgi:hypothetical protein